MCVCVCVALCTRVDKGVDKVPPPPPSARTHTHTHMHTCTHTTIHTYTHTHIHTYTHTHIHTYTHAHIHTYTHTHIHTYTHAHTHIHTYTHTHTSPKSRVSCAVLMAPANTRLAVSWGVRAALLWRSCRLVQCSLHSLSLSLNKHTPSMHALSTRHHKAEATELIRTLPHANCTPTAHHSHTRQHTTTPDPLATARCPAVPPSWWQGRTRKGRFAL